MVCRKRVVVWLLAVAVTCSVSMDLNAYAFESNPKNEKANTFLMAENYREALLLYEKTLEQEPEDFEAGFGRAMCLVRLNRYYLALEQLSTLKGEDEEELLKISDSMRQIKQTLAVHPNREVIDYYRNLTANEKSLAAMDVMLREYPDYPATDYYKTCLYTEVFDYEFCRQLPSTVLQELGDYYQKAVEEFSWQEDFQTAYRENLAIQLDEALALENHEQAEKLLEAALACDPDNVKFLVDRGELLYEQGNYEEAAQICEQVIAKDPDMESAYGFLLRCAYREKEYDETIAYGERLLQVNPDNLYGMAFLNRACKKLGRKEESEQWLYSMKTVSGSNYDRACAYAITGNKQLAMAFIENAVSEEPEAAFYAKYDKDLKPLHFNRRFRELVQEEYVEELGDYYAAIILLAGLAAFALFYFSDLLDKKRRVVKGTLLMLLVLLFTAWNTQETQAKNYRLREEETKEYFYDLRRQDQEEQTVGNDTQELCCENELEWLLESIDINERTLTPLAENDATEAALRNKCSTVNVQAMKDGSVCGQGSGVIIGYDKEKITIAGCRHTLYSSNLRVRFGNGDSAKAKLIGKSENYDFMILEVNTDDLFVETKDYIKRVNIDYSANAALKPGDSVASNGFISTKGFIYFTGEVTNLRKSFSNFEPYYTNHVPFLLTSTKAEAGTSGGGTFDGYGNFIGLQAGIVLATGERYVVPFDIIAEQYQALTGTSLE